ncbi:MAG: hypothetical protein FWE34_06275, partial [Defluviitaleaceae bacterium]|nr:hypothetical protein [Defluviitaleaceae bacterium]
LERMIASTNAKFREMHRMAQEIDGRYARRMEEMKWRINAYTKKMEAIRDGFSMGFLSLAGDMDSGSASAMPPGLTSPSSTNHQDLWDYIMALAEISKLSYSMNPNVATELQRALNSIPNIADRTAILNIMIDAPIVNQNLIFAVANQLNINAISGASGVFQRPNITNGFQPTIVFCPEADRANPRGSFYTFFHEVGHLVDWVFSDPRDPSGDDMLTRGSVFGGRLYGALTKDVSEGLHNIANGLPRPPGVTQDMIDRSVNNIINGISVEGLSFLSLEQQFQSQLEEVANIVLRPLNDTQTQVNMVVPGSAFGSITLNVVRGNWAHTTHGYHYHNDNKETPTYRQASEFFANYFASTSLGNQAMLDNKEQFLPNATEFMRQEIIPYLESRMGG